jgi:hypothetical protein
MSTYHEAADSIRRAAKQYEVFVKAAEILETTGSFENAAKEAQAAHAAAVKARDTALGELAQAKVDLAKAIDLAAKVSKGAKEEFEAVLADARIKAENEATGIKDKAKAAAAKIIAVANAKAEEAEARMRANDEEAAQLATEVKELRAECQVLVADRDKLQAAMDSLKAKFA